MLENAWVYRLSQQALDRAFFLTLEDSEILAHK